MQILFVISQTGYQRLEFNIPKKILEANGHRITVASLDAWECFSWDWIEITKADLSISQAMAWDYEMIVFVWWWWTYNDFIWNEDYYILAKNAKKIWAICIAPTIISYSWVLNWKKVTWWNLDWMQQEEMENNWAIFTGNNVEVDSNIVTANWPGAAEEFWEKLLDLLRPLE